MKRAGDPLHTQVSVPPELAVGVMVTTAFCVVLSPLMVMRPVVGLMVPPVTLPTTATVSCAICGEASEMFPVPADWTASEIDVLKPEPARISSETRARTV